MKVRTFYTKDYILLLQIDNVELKKYNYVFSTSLKGAISQVTNVFSDGTILVNNATRTSKNLFYKVLAYRKLNKDAFELLIPQLPLQNKTSSEDYVEDYSNRTTLESDSDHQVNNDGNYSLGFLHGYTSRNDAKEEFSFTHDELLKLLIQAIRSPRYVGCDTKNKSSIHT